MKIEIPNDDLVAVYTAMELRRLSIRNQAKEALARNDKTAAEFFDAEAERMHLVMLSVHAQASNYSTINPMWLIGKISFNDWYVNATGHEPSFENIKLLESALKMWANGEES